MTAPAAKPKRAYRYFTAKELALGAELYKTHSLEEVARILGRDKQSLRNSFAYYGIYKSEETKAIALSDKRRRVVSSQCDLGKVMREARELMEQGLYPEALDLMDDALAKIDGLP